MGLASGKPSILERFILKNDDGNMMGINSLVICYSLLLKMAHLVR